MLEFQTPIKGYDVTLPYNSCQLYEDGNLWLCAGFVWDFGSYAVDTPAMVIASAAHDAFCLMTDKGLLPWECRAMADRYFRDQLKANGTPFMRRWWCWAGVRTYSKTVAFWSRKR